MAIIKQVLKHEYDNTIFEYAAKLPDLNTLLECKSEYVTKRTGDKMIE